MSQPIILCAEGRINISRGKYALITGTSQGLGLQKAIAYAQEGAAGIAIIAGGTELLKKARHPVKAASSTTKFLAIVFNSANICNI
jgi:NAD(P)-dependent dehydrogenase (short-subunit alcohol dehydrogenase family)